MEIKTFKCKICHRFETKAGNGFNKHIGKEHNMTYKEYVIKTEFNNIEPLCKTCNNALKMLKGKIRFPVYCSHRCAALGENNGMHGKKGIESPNRGIKRTIEQKEKYREAAYKRYSENPEYVEKVRKQTIQRIKNGTFNKRSKQVNKVYNPATNSIEVFDSSWEEEFVKFCIDVRNIPITKLHDIEIDYVDSSKSNKRRIYLPDFVDLENSRIIEIKGKMNLNACDKIKAAQRYSEKANKAFEVWTKKNGTFYELKVYGDIWVEKDLYGSSSVVSCREKKLTSTYLKTLSIRERKILAAKLFRFYRKFGFPFKEAIDDNTMINEFKALQAYTKESKQIGKEEPEFSSGTYKGKLIIDNFYDKHFHEVKSPNKPSLIEAFNDDLKLYRVITNRLGISYKEYFNIHGAMIRQGFRSSGIAAVVSSYSGEYVKHILLQHIKNIKPNINVLDFSMGFGQRMLATLSINNLDYNESINYIGIDPWNEQIRSANDMYKFLQDKELIDINKRTIDLYQCGSEDMIHNNQFIEKYRNKVDIVYTSPPYFDFECYGDNFSFYTSKEQRMKNYQEKFIDGWLKPTIRMLSEVIKPSSGIIVINVSGKPFKIGKHTFSFLDDLKMYFEAIEIGFKLIGTHIPKNNKVLHFNKANGLNTDNINSNEILLQFKKA